MANLATKFHPLLSLSLSLSLSVIASENVMIKDMPGTPVVWSASLSVQGQTNNTPAYQQNNV